MSDPERGSAGTWSHLAWWRDGALDLSATLRDLPSNDRDTALAIAAERPGQLHYAVQAGQWHIWDGRCHRPDDGDRISRLVIGWGMRMEQMLAAARQESAARTAARMQGGTEAELRREIAGAWEPWTPALKYAAGLSKSAGMSSLLRMLAAVCGCPDGELDERHPGWLNFADATMDLVTGRRKRHDPADLITYSLAHPWQPGPCPVFERLARRVCGGDDAVFRYLMRVLGYCLLGANPERRIFFLNGPTSSGKSVLLDVVRGLSGGLGHSSQASLITLVRHGRNARTMNSIRGKRLLTITETSAFMHVDEGQLKMITGERSISVDQHYAKAEIDTPVTWTIVVATNQMPSLADFDAAMRERVVVIPTGPTIPEGERDKQLASRILETEGPAVLAALAAECAAYHREGLTAPLAVSMETDRYRAEQNTVDEFVADCCLIAGWVQPGGAVLSISQADAWEQYARWSRGSVRLSKQQFFERMSMHPAVTRNPDMRRFEGVTWQPRLAAELST